MYVIKTDYSILSTSTVQPCLQLKKTGKVLHYAHSATRTLRFAHATKHGLEMATYYWVRARFTGNHGTKHARCRDFAVQLQHIWKRSTHVWPNLGCRYYVEM